MTDTPKESGRDVALDWVKGALVVLMVVYHAMGYSHFVGLSFRYLAFLPPSFISISGFLVTNLYISKYGIRNWRMHRRLLIRGAKLILLFTILNLVSSLIDFRRSSTAAVGFSALVANWPTLYFSPAGDSASFTIVLSIGYLLVVAPFLALLQSLRPWVLPALATVLFCLCSYLEWSTRLNYHLSMLTIGTVGMALGALSLERIGQWARAWLIVAPAFVGYRACSFFMGDPFPIQVAGVCITLLVLYGLALSFPTERFTYRQMAVLGRHSLVGYIFQLAVLQVLYRLRLSHDPCMVLPLMIVITMIATWAMTRLLEKLCAAAPLLNSMYKAVFA